MRRIKYGKRPCRMCGRMVTKNALGRAAHERACYGKLRAERPALNPTMPKTGWPEPKGGE